MYHCGFYRTCTAPVQVVVCIAQSTNCIDFVSRLLHLLEGGIIKRWKQSFWPKDDPCGRHGVKTKGIPLSLLDTSGAFVVLGIGLTIGAISLAVEMIMGRYRNVSSRRNKPCKRWASPTMKPIHGNV